MQEGQGGTRISHNPTNDMRISHIREHAPSIIFMDEVDSIGSARTDNSGGGGDSEVQRTMLELLNQLDGFEATNKIKVGAWVVNSFPCLCGAVV